jgi:hypothetical protein
MQTQQPIFAQTVIRVEPGAGQNAESCIFKIYGVQQPLHVLDPCRIVPRNDNHK